MSRDWSTVSLSELLSIQNGYAFDSKQFAVTGGIPLIRIRDLKNGIGTETNFIGQYDTRYEVHSGDLLIGMDGEFACYRWKGPTALLNQRVCRLHQFVPTLLPDFLLYGINKYLKEIEDRTTYTTVKHLSAKTIRDISIPLPSIAEQKRIVAILDEAFAGIDAAVANAEKNLANARELFERSMASRLSTGVSDKQTVAEIARREKGSIRTGPFGSQLLHSEFVDEGIPVLGIDNVVENEFRWGRRRYITPEKFRKLSRYEVKAGDVLISIMGTCGRCAVVPDDIPTAINSKHLCCITLDQTRCLPGYLHACFLYHPTVRQFIEDRAEGSIMKGLNMSIIQSVPIPLPPVEEQRIILDQMITLTSHIKRLKVIVAEKLRNLADLKQSILQKAFAGELTAKEAEREMAAA